MSPLEIQWFYFELADAYLEHFGFTPEEDAIMHAWERALSDIEQDPMKLRDRADWVAKKRVLDTYLAQVGASWEGLPDDILDTLHARDLLYHDMSSNGLFNHFFAPDTLVTLTEIEQAKYTSPQYTRARVRGEAIKQARLSHKRVIVERWQYIVMDGKKIRLSDPLDFDNIVLEFDKGWWTNSVMHENLHIRLRAVQLLAWQPHGDALSLLMNKAQHDSDEQVRRAAVVAIGYRADKLAKDVLITCLGDSFGSVRWAAEEALELVQRGIPTQPPTLPETEEEQLIQIIQP